MDSRAPNGWFEHVCKAEHLFLENLYEASEMFQMGILDFEIFMKKVARVLDRVDEFCESIEREHLEKLIGGQDCTEIETLVEKIKKTKTYKNDANDECTKKKAISYLYQHTIKFLPNDKIDPTFPMSHKFIQNLHHIFTNKSVVHHIKLAVKILQI